MTRLLKWLFDFSVYVVATPIALVTFFIAVGVGIGSDLARLWRDWR